MKSLRKSQTLAILAAGNGIQWRKSESSATTGDFGAGSWRGFVLGCTGCFTSSDSDDEEDNSSRTLLPAQTKPTVTKAQIAPSNSSTSISSSKFSSSSAAPSLPPLECETVHITFRRDILLASPSSMGTWAADLIPTPPERSSSRTSASYPLIRAAAGSNRHPYQFLPASTSSSTLNSNFERASIVPTAIKHALSHDLGLSDTFSPIQIKARTLHTERSSAHAEVGPSKSLSSLRSSAHLQFALALPSPPAPAFLQQREVMTGACTSSPSLKDIGLFQTRGLWPLVSASAVSSTDTLVSHEAKGGLESLKYSRDRSHSFDSKLPIIRATDYLDPTMTPPPAFTNAFLKSDSNYSPSFTIEAVSVPGSPTLSVRTARGRTKLQIERSPMTPATFDTFDTSGTPLVDRFPQVQPSQVPAAEAATMDWEASFRLIDMCGTSSDEPPQLVISEPDPAFLSPHWTSPAQRNRSEANGSGSSGDTQLSTPRCRKGLISSALSPSTAWLLRTAIQASDADGTEGDDSEQEQGEQGRRGSGRTHSTDVNNFKAALGRLQAAVSIPLTRHSFDGDSMAQPLLKQLAAAAAATASSSDVSVTSSPTSSPEQLKKTNADPVLSDLLFQLGMQPLTPPLRSSSSSNGQFDAAEVAANWAARCRRSLCKAAHNSGLSPGSLLDFSAPESPGSGESLPDLDEQLGIAVPVAGAQSKEAGRRKSHTLPTVEEDEVDSPAPSFNFSICQQTPVLDDFPYTLAMLASLRQCRSSNLFPSSAGRLSELGSHAHAPATASSLGQDAAALDCTPTAASSSSALASALPTIGLGLGGTAFEMQPTAASKERSSVAGGAESIFELYGQPSTPRILQGATTTLRRSASDASVQTVRSSRATGAVFAAATRTARRSSMLATPTTPRPANYGAWAAAEGQEGEDDLLAWHAGWAGRSEPKCPPPSCPLPPLPDHLRSRPSLLLKQRPTRTFI
ncbi:hypothetical protein OC834_003115 [Tilletia horrida]|uniref:Uncharacterized protein n=1 Tax=Tilletia horrida TaxID=155126 RepID=A0AAN6GHG7_9BASI|nr:hypothetical protein OC834_003115 [Tilletia horrida]KAK0541081.1 hypothetical protein OC842_000170 [Tilletia horrida]